MTQLNDATLRQNQAAEPGNSTWLSANAGSGKTRVLTDRVARLLLDRVQPQNILCLTYTKAAASEMQNRLFARLGAWAMKPDTELAAELAGLGVSHVDDPDRLRDARQLFARAIETPGGLRIQTIHSFCASLLRRFPLEAGVTPNFTEMDDRAAVMLRADVMDAIADGPQGDVFDQVAQFASGSGLDGLARALVSHREAFDQTHNRDDVLGWFDLPPDFTAAAAIGYAFDGSETDLVAQILPITRTQSKMYAGFGDTLAQLDLENPDHTVFDALCKLFLYASGDKKNESKSANFPQSNHKKAVDAFAPFIDDLHQFMDRIAAAKQTLIALFAAEKTWALYQFAKVYLPMFEARKQIRGWLDFDDLILKSRALLANPNVAAWVLYRLDGGLDHILVDEAQDTSPVQWQVIEQLAQEFTSGIGARDDVQRTIFVVGDQKQSIYSFQGADPREFERMRGHFGQKLAALGQNLRSMELEYSFRSSDAILRFVDRLISVSGMGHRAFRDQLPGRVDLWPTVPVSEPPEKPNWYDPVDIKTEDHHAVILARRIAAQIKEMIESETIPAGNGQRRPVQAGDILILVRRRSDLFEEIIRACKALRLPVAGADRLKLGAELAVKDLSALLSFLATPEDSLSLATTLKSPLFGWFEADLYNLAAKRSQPYLWQALRDRAEEFPQTYAMITDLRDNADFLRPYDLIERILTIHAGRKNLLARLGPEAEDGIDALLIQSLNYERMDVPSLTGFLAWLETDEIEIKRQMDTAGNLIRVMTVHGAKGLEAPIVILPDTAKRANIIRDDVISAGQGRVFWKTSADQQPEAMKDALEALKSAQAEEDERLLYVAATRAETWLIIAAAGDVGDIDESWHQKAQSALFDLGAVHLETPSGDGLRLGHMAWDSCDLIDAGARDKTESILPEWVNSVAPMPTKTTNLRSPSNLGGEKALAGPGGQDEEAALRHGDAVHALLEHLPNHPMDDWDQVAGGLLDDNAIDQALAEARTVLTRPELSHLFAADALSEVEITAILPDLGGDRIVGVIDKLIISPTHILAVDFKTNAVLPSTEDLVPEGILRQMGAYQAALEQVYPDHHVGTAILWTRGPVLMPLPHEIVRQALTRAATS